MSRRQSDIDKQRIHSLILYLALALSTLAAYMGNIAIRAVNAQDKSNEAAFQFGRMIGNSQHKAMPEMPDMRRQ